MSTFTAHEILCVDAVTPNEPPTVIPLVGFAAVAPEDMVFGPDGNVYVADSTNNRVLRF